MKGAETRRELSRLLTCCLSHQGQRLKLQPHTVDWRTQHAASLFAFSLEFVQFVSPQHISSVQSCRCLWAISDLLVVLLHSCFHITHLNVVLLLAAAAFSMSFTPASTWRIWLILVFPLQGSYCLCSTFLVRQEFSQVTKFKPVDLCKAREVIGFIFKKKMPKILKFWLVKLKYKLL